MCWLVLKLQEEQEDFEGKEGREEESVSIIFIIIHESFIHHII